MNAQKTYYGPDGRALDGPRTTAADYGYWYPHYDGAGAPHDLAMWRNVAADEGARYVEAIRGARAMRARGAHVTRHTEDYIECVCGNAPHLDGFYCSDPDGTTRELGYGPEPEWDNDTMTCYACGRAFSLESGAIVGYATYAMLTGARMVVG